MREEIIGPCRLILGDCLEVLPRLGKVDAVVTDPPYKHAHMDGGGFASARKFYAGGAIDFISDFDLQEYRTALSSASDQLIAFCSRDLILKWLAFGEEEFGKTDLHVWHKTNAIPFTCNTWKSDLEYIVLMWRSKNHQEVAQHEKSKAYISALCMDNFHPTAKPVPLMKKYVSVLLAPNGTALDPFMGSGTTGVACIRTGRKFIGIEKEERYFDIAVKRIQREWNLKCSELPFEEPEPLKQLSLIDTDSVG